MEHRTAQITADDGCPLFRQAWLPDGAARAAVAVVHGYGEHGGRYGDVVQTLRPLGIAVHSYDLRGHGRSGGGRGHVDRFARYLADTAAFTSAVAGEHPGTPLFLLGHSFGGLIAALYGEAVGAAPGGLALTPPAGIMLSAPFLALAAPVSGAKLAGAKVLARLAPARDVGNTLSAADLSHDQVVVDAYRADPLNHHVATARWAVETLAAQRRALDGAARLRQPLLMQWGADDRVAAPAAALAFSERAGSADKTRHVYPGFFHEIFNEVGKAQPLADLAAWLQARLPG